MDFLSVFSHLDQSQIGQLTLQHLLLVLIAVGLTILVGMSLDTLMTRFTWLTGPLQGVVTVMLTVPSVALFGPPVPVYPVLGQGLGPLSAITAVFLYSLLPVLRNTYLALTGVEADTHEVSKGISMALWQRLWTVDIPLAAPVILTGIHTAMVMNIGVMTIAAVIGAGGLGVLILISISQSNMPMLVVGMVLVSLLAIATDPLPQWLQCILTPKGLHTSAR